MICIARRREDAKKSHLRRSRFNLQTYGLAQVLLKLVAFGQKHPLRAFASSRDEK
jgi:hypothetical protein